MEFSQFRLRRPSNEQLQKLEQDGWFFYRNPNGRLVPTNKDKFEGLKGCVRGLPESTPFKLTSDQMLKHMEESPHFSIIDFYDEWSAAAGSWYRKTKIVTK